jgi:hypothetical protein
MDVRSIPRMPPFHQRVFWTAIGANVLYLIAMVVLQPEPELVYSVVACVYASVFIWFSARRVMLVWQVRRAVMILRRFDTPQRSNILGGLDDEAVQAYLQRRLDDHGQPTTVGLVERFEFSPVDRREYAAATWASIAAAAGVLTPAFALSAGSVGRTVAVCCAAGLVALSLVLRRIASQFDRVFEVSHFGIAEVQADGSVRHIPWARDLSVRNRPWLRRIELRDGRTSIDVQCSVVGSERLFKLILSRGGFSDEAA